jgi:hypothetical protein
MPKRNALNDIATMKNPKFSAWKIRDFFIWILY